MARAKAKRKRVTFRNKMHKGRSWRSIKNEMNRRKFDKKFQDNPQP